MSKDNANLRLLGSPVNLTYRSKKKDDKKNIRNRPRSALQNSCFTPENQERYKRPFSADAKERAPSTRTFYKTFSSELLQSFNNRDYPTCEGPYTFPALPPGSIRTSPIHTDFPITTIKVVPPTTDILGNTKSESHGARKDKDLCSNASDIGSEDTFISLGTKIKNRAQLAPKIKSPSAKNLKYRNIAKRNRKHMENTNEEKQNNEYGMEVKITDRNQRVSSPIRSKEVHERTPSPTFKKRSYDAYFIPVEGSSLSKSKDEDLAGRVSFGSSGIQAEVEQAIDTYSRRLNLTKQQLSLVEEESTQDIESPSQRMSSLSPENLLEDNKNEDTTGNTTHVEKEKNGSFPKTQNFINEPRTYSSFYDDFQYNAPTSYQAKNRASILQNDSSSKDSGYHDSGQSDTYGQNYSLPSTSLVKSFSQTKIEDQPKSLDSASSNEKDYRTFPLDKKSQWAEPLNHSRLLYKDFFLKKEGHIALPPQNSPVKENSNDVASEENKCVKETESTDYPSYLMNSTTKAYTSKVIEDYKKELEAINNLHELTIKDIKTDAISPTPFNIDKMFDDHSCFDVDKNDANKSAPMTNVPTNKNSLDVSKADISKVSTKELIQNYLKVKEGDHSKDYASKTLKKFDNKPNNITSKSLITEPNISSYKQDWNNKVKANASQVPKSSNLKSQNQKNQFTLRTPVSARLESVQNDKDIDSWMSLSASSPRTFEMEPLKSPRETNVQEPKLPERMATAESSPNYDSSQRSPRRNQGSTEKTPRFDPNQATTSAQDTSRSKDLNPHSTVLDIYSMLKEIESYGDNPVTSVAKVDIPEPPKQETTEDRNPTPKDNFTEIFEFLEKVEQSANDALNVVTTSTPQTIPKLESLLKLPQTELAQRLVTASLQLEERSCCIALLQESLQNHKEQMVSKVSNLEKQSTRNIARVKQECEEAIKRHQSFIDQLINDKKTLNHRIEQLVDERRSLEERWKRSAQALEERYKLELRNQHDKMAAAQQVARQRWVRQKAEKIKELTVKGLEGELREMAERQQKEISDLKMFHAEHTARLQAKHSAQIEELKRNMDEEKEAALLKERHLASSRMEKQILELELTYQEQRTRLVAEMRAENERAALTLGERDKLQRQEIGNKQLLELELTYQEQRTRLVAEMRAENERAALTLGERDKLQRQEIGNKQLLELELTYQEQRTRLVAEMRAENERAALTLGERDKLQRQEIGNKQVLELELTYQEQRTRLVAEMRAENERAALTLGERDKLQRQEIGNKQLLELELTYQEQRTRLVAEMRAENERAALTLGERDKLQRQEIGNKQLLELELTYQEQRTRLVAEMRAENERAALTLGERDKLQRQEIGNKQLLELELTYQEQRTRLVAEMRAENERAALTLGERDKLQRQEIGNKQLLELELTYQEQRTRLVAEMRAENERAALTLGERDKLQRQEIGNKQLLELELTYQEQRTRLVAEMRAENERAALTLGERDKLQRQEIGNKQLLELELTYQEQRTRLVAEMRAENERAALTLGERDKLQRQEIGNKQLLELELTYQEQRTRLVAEMRAENERAALTLGERDKLQRQEIGNKQLLELELTYQEQRTRLVAEMRAENERAALTLGERDKLQRQEIGNKQVLELELTYQEQRTRLVAEMRAENERAALTLGERDKLHRQEIGNKQVLELELTYQEQRTRLVAEMRAENERAALTLGERDKLHRQEIEKWKEEQEQIIMDKKIQLEKEIAKEKENIEVLLQQKQQELEQKLEQHKKEFEAEQQLQLKRKVTEISAQHKLERDREIERAIESMEAEAQQGRKELQDALKRNKEQYEAELRSLAETEQATLRRYQDAQARIRQTEDRCAELEVSISQLETRNKILTEKNIQLENQASEMTAQCEKAWQSKVETLQREMEDLKKTHDEQMHQLYAKVKVAVARKDSAIQALTREAAKYQEKITLLESKLQQQRKDFLKQIK